MLDNISQPFIEAPRLQLTKEGHKVVFESRIVFLRENLQVFLVPLELKFCLRVKYKY